MCSQRVTSPEKWVRLIERRAKTLFVLFATFTPTKFTDVYSQVPGNKGTKHVDDKRWNLYGHFRLFSRAWALLENAPTGVDQWFYGFTVDGEWCIVVVKEREHVATLETTTVSLLELLQRMGEMRVPSGPALPATDVVLQEVLGAGEEVYLGLGRTVRHIHERARARYEAVKAVVRSIEIEDLLLLNQ